jgi:hypothetical protein
MTKQLKLAIVLLITVASMNVNAQKKGLAKVAKTTNESKTAKPTKVETMDWIAGKMKENIAKPDRKKFKSYSNGILVLEGFFNDASTSTFYSIDLNKVTGMSDEYSSDFYISGKQILNSKWPERGQEMTRSIDNLSISGSNYNEYESFFNFTSDQALVERLKKAFATLIEYNSTKKEAGEAF